jgi:hypothetical protein
MKVITLKNVIIDYGEDDASLIPANAPKNLDYRTTIMSLLKSPKDPQAGASFEETAEAMPIWKKFREHKMPAMGDSEILLEDAEHKFVVDCVTKNAKYIQRSWELFEMGQSLIDAPDHLSKVAAEKS